MLCLKNYHKIGSGILLSVFFAVLSVLFFLNTNVSAVSDLTITVDDNNYSTVDFNCGSDCSSYHYLLFSDLSGVGGFSYSMCPYYSNSFIRIQFNINADFRSNFVFQLTSFDNADQMKYCAASWAPGTSFKLTLTENNPFGSAPSGSITLTENGSFVVTSYATAIVDVPPTIDPGDYHDDLISIQQAIYVCGAILLVLYFFYCIYRMIIKTTGGYL